MVECIDKMTEGARAFALVASCFLFTSTGYLVWLYRLIDVTTPASVDFLSMVVGYAFQALGIGLYALLLNKRPLFNGRRLCLAAIGAFLACLAAVSAANGLASLLAPGYASNLVCGIIAAYYLHCLAAHVPENRRGTVFGTGYAAATLATWLLSLPFDEQMLHSQAALPCCAVLAALAAASVWAAAAPAPADSPSTCRHPAPDVAGESNGTQGLIALASVMVLVMCLAKSLGNSFPTADLAEGLNLEFARLFYAMGLVIAGMLSDRDRRIGLACCMAALALPFITLSLSGSSASATVLWGLGYFLFGFFSVYRVILFSDLAARSAQMHQSGWGLMLGRLGDSLGTALCLALVSQQAALVLCTAALFAASVFLALMLYQRMHAPVTAPAAQSQPAPSEMQVFEEFAARYALSSREREVFRLLLAERTNQEIAAALFISENTVKFHVRNLLKKTDSKNRMELRAKYAERPPQ